MKKNILVFLLCLSTVFSLFSQSFLGAPSSPFDKTETQSSTLFDTTKQLLLAISSKNYPVTPGDVYILSYLSRDEIINLEFLIPFNNELNLKDLGIIDAQGMTFYELKRDVEKVFNAAYPGSFPTLSLQSVGFFHVPIIGALPETKYSLAWGLSRLSEIIEGLIDVNFSSIRDIEIISDDGSRRTIDYFQAIQMGDLSQDPIVKQGDTIRINEVQRVVEVQGEFVKPGTYQLLNSEDWRDLYRYTGGVSDKADISDVAVYRSPDGKKAVKMIFDKKVPFELEDGDRIVVNPVLEYGGYLNVDGALITQDSSDSTTIDINTSDTSDGREVMVNEALQFPFITGETLRDVLLKASSSFSADADLDHCLLYQGFEIRTVNVRDLLFHQGDNQQDFILTDGDRLFIPQKKVYISVQGAVQSSGTFLYYPGENPEYYIQMAGGIEPYQSKGDFVVLDALGNKKKNSDLAPGDTVYVPQNSFAYNFSTYMPIITTTLALITSVISVFSTLQN